MNFKLESIVNKGKILFAAGLASLMIGCASLSNYAEAKAGAIMPISEKQQKYNPSALAGISFGTGGRHFGLETGAEYFHSSAQYIKTNSILSRISLSYSPLNPKSKVKPYLIAGASSLSEFSSINVPQYGIHQELSSTTFGLDAGIGLTLFDRIDLKVINTWLEKSENVTDTLNATIGYRFFVGKK